MASAVHASGAMVQQRARHTGCLRAAAWALAALLPALAGAQTESALPATAAPMFRIQGWVERVEGSHVTLRAPDGLPVTVDMSEMTPGAVSALTPGRLVGLTVVAQPDGSLAAQAVAFEYGAPAPDGG